MVHLNPVTLGRGIEGGLRLGGTGRVAGQLACLPLGGGRHVREHGFPLLLLTVELRHVLLAPRSRSEPDSRALTQIRGSLESLIFGDKHAKIFVRFTYKPLKRGNPNSKNTPLLGITDARLGEGLLLTCHIA